MRKKETEISFGITSLPKRKANRARLLELHRGHWTIENKIHWVRDAAFDEDRSQVRKRAGAQTMASLRNTSINLLRLAGANNIAKAARHCCRHPGTALRLTGLRVAA